MSSSHRDRNRSYNDDDDRRRRRSRDRDGHGDRDRHREEDSRGRYSNRDDNRQRHRGNGSSSYDAEYESRRFRDRRDRETYEKYSRRSCSREENNSSRRGRKDNDEDRSSYHHQQQQRHQNTSREKHNGGHSDDSSSRGDYEWKRGGFGKNQQQQQSGSETNAPTYQSPLNESKQATNKTESDYLSKMSDKKLQESMDRYDADPDYSITDGLLDNIVIDKEKIQAEMQERLRQHLLAEGKLYPPKKPEPAAVAGAFVNDGSFLDMFKKMQQQQQESQEGTATASGSSTATLAANIAQPTTSTITAKPTEVKRPVGPMYGKRRGGKILKTGIVAKKKPIEEFSNTAVPGDAWSQYMNEVKRYKAVSCDVDNKNRPLVK